MTIHSLLKLHVTYNFLTSYIMLVGLKHGNIALAMLLISSVKDYFETQVTHGIVRMDPGSLIFLHRSNLIGERRRIRLPQAMCLVLATHPLP